MVKPAMTSIEDARIQAFAENRPDVTYKGPGKVQFEGAKEQTDWLIQVIRFAKSGCKDEPKTDDPRRKQILRLIAQIPAMREQLARVTIKDGAIVSADGALNVTLSNRKTV